MVDSHTKQFVHCTGLSWPHAHVLQKPNPGSSAEPGSFALSDTNHNKVCEHINDVVLRQACTPYKIIFLLEHIQQELSEAFLSLNGVF